MSGLDSQLNRQMRDRKLQQLKALLNSVDLNNTQDINTVINLVEDVYSWQRKYVQS